MSTAKQLNLSLRYVPTVAYAHILKHKAETHYVEIRASLPSGEYISPPTDQRGRCGEKLSVAKILQYHGSGRVLSTGVGDGLLSL